MLPWLEIFTLFGLAAGGWLWWDGAQAREAAVGAARKACAGDGLLLLDDTVALASLRPARDDLGKLQLRRLYHFEYSDTGNNRRQGRVTLLGSELEMIYVGPRPVREEDMEEAPPRPPLDP